MKILFLLLLCQISMLNSQETLPFEEKAKYERFLSQKADDVLVKLLGPNQAKVIVETIMDFSKTEKVEYEKQKETKSFALQSQAGDVSGIEYLMPGFGLPVQNHDSPKAYIKQMIIPSAFIKRIKATILVNKNLDEATILSIRNVVQEVLDIKKERGDDIVIVKASFAPIWKTIWYNPESMSFVLKYIIIAILGIIGLITVSIGFLKLAGAMNTMAKVQQSHQITMELGNMSKEAPPGGFLTSISNPIPFVSGAKQESTQNQLQEDNTIYFDVKEHQIDALVSLMIKEDPSNVAIVVSHLRKAIKEEFLKRLPSEFAAEVIAGLSKIRFIENDTIALLKEELETRLSGAIGGIRNAIEAFENMSPKKRIEMIKTIEKNHPETAIEIRKAMLFFDDLKFLDERDFSILVSSIEIGDWTNVYNDLDDEFKEKLKQQLSATSWKIIEETNKYEKASAEKVEKSMENIIEVAQKLIYEGRIKKPIINSSHLITNEKDLNTNKIVEEQIT